MASVTTVNMMMHCPQCGFGSHEFAEGVCLDCRDENQRQLDEHNALFDQWEGMSHDQRAKAIKGARDDG